MSTRVEYACSGGVEVLLRGVERSDRLQQMPLAPISGFSLAAASNSPSASSDLFWRW